MYNIFRILIGVPDYSSSSFFLNEEEAIPPPPDKQNNRFPDADNIGYTV